MSKFTEKIKEIRFEITYACNSRCRHCVSARRNTGAYLEAKPAVEMLRELSKASRLSTVSIYGGEPMLYPDTVAAICSTARELGIPQRRLSTNGGLWEQISEMEKQVDMILSSGVTEVALSVDTFHMEFIPLIRQHTFAKLLISKGFQGLKLHPVWVVSQGNDNLFNLETKECLRIFRDIDVPIDEGTVIQPEAEAKKYLDRFYQKGLFDRKFRCGDEIGTVRLDEPAVIGVRPDGDVTICCFTIGNLRQKGILEILDSCELDKNPMAAALQRDGILGLQEYMEGLGFKLELSDYYTACEFCHEMQRLHRSVMYNFG